MGGIAARTTQPGRPAEVFVSGEIDMSTSDDLFAVAMESLERQVPGVVIDMTELTFLDSSGLGALIRIRIKAEAAGKTLTLFRPPLAIMRLLDVTGLTDHFAIEQNPDDHDSF